MTGKTSIAALEIVSKCGESTPIQYQDVEITGNLDFTAVDAADPLDDTRSICPAMTFTNCVFSGEVLAYHDEQDVAIQFDESLTLRDCEFRQAIDFRQAGFLDTVTFENARFEQAVTFEEATFSTRADFRGAQFAQRADMSSAQFLSGGDFEGARFAAEAWFAAAQFLQTANFEGAEFLGPACFYCVQFSDGLFSSVVFEEHADFDGAQFSGDAILEATQFLASSGFGEAVFDGIVDLSSAVFEQAPVLWETDFRDQVYFDGARCGDDPFNPLEPG